MGVKFEEQEDGRYRIVRGDSAVGVVVPQDNGEFGYSLYGTPHMGKASSLEDVEKAVKRYLG